MRIVEVDCPDCLQLDADRQARTELHDAHSIPADDAAVPVGELVERIEWLEQVVAGLVEQLDTAPVKQDLMTPGEVIDMFGITPKTLRKWVKDGLIAYIVLPSGHRRYLRAEIEAYMQPGTPARNGIPFCEKHDTWHAKNAMCLPTEQR